MARIGGLTSPHSQIAANGRSYREISALPSCSSDHFPEVCSRAIFDATRGQLQPQYRFQEWRSPEAVWTYPPKIIQKTPLLYRPGDGI